MNLRTDPARWLSYSGTWYFSIYDNYRLTLRPTRRGVSLRLRDLDFGEDGELVPLRASDEQLVFRLCSERLNARLRLYPEAAGQGLIVEFSDVDVYRRRPAVEVDSARETEFYPEDGEHLPDWALGTWVESSSGGAFLNLRRGEVAGRWRLALWSDHAAPLPRLVHDEATDRWDLDWAASDAAPLTGSNRCYRRILELPGVGHRGIEMVWRGGDALNRRMEARLAFDEARQRLLLALTRRVAAHREL